MALPTPEELEALTEAELRNLGADVAYEQHRREELEVLPQDIEVMTQRFVDHGGEKTRIKDPKDYQRGNRPERPGRPPRGGRA